MTCSESGTPRMGTTTPTTTAGLLICEHCDTVYRRRPLARGEVACCERCNFVLERHPRLGPDQLLALTATAMLASTARDTPIEKIRLFSFMLSSSYSVLQSLRRL